MSPNPALQITLAIIGEMFYNRSHDGEHHAVWQMRLSLGYAVAGNRTTLVRRRHDGPLLVQKSLYPEGPEVCHTMVLFPPGGIAAGDHLNIMLDLSSHSRVLLTTPAAGKWYKSLGAKASQIVSVKLGPVNTIEVLRR